MMDGEKLAEMILPFIREGLEVAQESLYSESRRSGSQIMDNQFADNSFPDSLSRDWLVLFAETIKEKIRTLAEARDFIKVVDGSPVGELDEEAQEALRGDTVGAVRDAFRGHIEEAREVSELNPNPGLDPALAKSIIKQLGKDLGLKGKDIFMPLRVSVTGQLHGPDLDRICALLGPDNILARLEQTEKYVVANS
jgi:nondiscriminating glutamyl-tRNA synthetase